MSKAISFFTIAAIVFVSCASPSVVTVYKNRDNHTSNIHAVLVAAVIAGADTIIRNQLENYFSIELKKAGYNAVTTSAAFGSKGLGSLGQEETLMKLCNYGFDAVLTVALVDGSKEKYKNPPPTSAFAAGYYLNRIWNYEKIEANVSSLQNSGTHFWECILFDLYSLRPISAVQTKLFYVDKTGAIDPGLAKIIIAKMTKEKVIRKQNGKRPVDRSIVKK
jgi:hypothetical protein